MACGRSKILGMRKQSSIGCANPFPCWNLQPAPRKQAESHHMWLENVHMQRAQSRPRIASCNAGSRADPTTPPPISNAGSAHTAQNCNATFFAQVWLPVNRRECEGQPLKRLKISCGQNTKTPNKPTNTKQTQQNPPRKTKRIDQEIFCISWRHFVTLHKIRINSFGRGLAASHGKECKGQLL